MPPPVNIRNSTALILVYCSACSYSVPRIWAQSASSCLACSSASTTYISRVQYRSTVMESLYLIHFLSCTILSTKPLANHGPARLHNNKHPTCSSSIPAKAELPHQRMYNLTFITLSHCHSAINTTSHKSSYSRRRAAAQYSSSPLKEESNSEEDDAMDICEEEDSHPFDWDSTPPSAPSPLHQHYKSHTPAVTPNFSKSSPNVNSSNHHIASGPTSPLLQHYRSHTLAVTPTFSKSSRNLNSSNCHIASGPSPLLQHYQSHTPAVTPTYKSSRNLNSSNYHVASDPSLSLHKRHTHTKCMPFCLLSHKELSSFISQPGYLLQIRPLQPQIVQKPQRTQVASMQWRSISLLKNLAWNGIVDSMPNPMSLHQSKKQSLIQV
jgi:hypothetical protein